MVKLSQVRTLLRESELSCVARGPDLANSKDYLLVFHPALVDRETMRDLLRVTCTSDRVLWFGVGGQYCFLSVGSTPGPFVRVSRGWQIGLYEDRAKLLDRINRLNKETTIQKITVSEKVTRWPSSKEKSVSGTIEVHIPIPFSGLKMEDIEHAIKRLLVVPVEEKLQAKVPKSVKDMSSKKLGAPSLSFDKDGNFVSSKPVSSKKEGGRAATRKKELKRGAPSKR